MTSPFTHLLVAAPLAVTVMAVTCHADDTNFSVEHGGVARVFGSRTELPSTDARRSFGPDAPSEGAVSGRFGVIVAHSDLSDLSIEIAGDGRVLHGDGRGAEALVVQGVGGIGGFSSDRERARLFDLSFESELDNGDGLVDGRIDRAVLTLEGEELTARIGRQATSWGSGLLFQPLDLMSPFAPTAIDREYKTGEDSLLIRYAPPSEPLSVEGLIVPRREIEAAGRGEIDHRESSIGLRARAEVSTVSLEFVGGSHLDDAFGGGGVSVAIGGGVLRGDILATDLGEPGTVTDIVINYDRSWVLFERNWYGFLELFHSDLGDREINSLVPSSPRAQALSERLARGERFTRGRDYLGAGITIELTPLVELSPVFIGNLHDESGLFLLRGTYEVAENYELLIGIDIPVGDSSSEFGGTPSADPGSPTLSPGLTTFVRLSYYFGA